MPSSAVKSHALPVLQAETAHILFMDIVGYSKLTTKMQRFVQDDLRKVVQATAEFQAAQVRGDLLSRPTGDGMALLFFGSALSPVQCAIQITRTLKDHPHVPLRMGIHTGPVLRVQDINAQSDIAGEGIVLAQRVMSLGDAGHILVSGAYAAQLGAIPVGKVYLTDLGHHLVKHGQSVHIFNLRDRHYGTPEYGNPIVPKQLRDEFSRRFHFAPAPAGSSRNPLLSSLLNAIKIAAAFAALLLILVSLCRAVDPDFVGQVERKIQVAPPASAAAPLNSAPAAPAPTFQSDPQASSSPNKVPLLIGTKFTGDGGRNGLITEERQGLTLVQHWESRRDYNNTQPAGEIYDQFPKPATEVPDDQRVYVYVSRGRRTHHPSGFQKPQRSQAQPEDIGIVKVKTSEDDPPPLNNPSGGFLEPSPTPQQTSPPAPEPQNGPNPDAPDNTRQQAP